ERIAGDEEEVVEPIYGKTYMPRKFKTVVALPPSNEVDVFAHDLGFIAILDAQDEVAGWNVTAGAGMGMTHGEPETYPRAADLLGFCRTEDALAIAEAVVRVQRDWGDRVNRKHARLNIQSKTVGWTISVSKWSAGQASSSIRRSHSLSPRRATATAGQKV